MRLLQPLHHFLGVLCIRGLRLQCEELHGELPKSDIPKSEVCHEYNRCYTARMSAIEMVIEKVKQLDEAHARQLLTWLQGQECAAAPVRQPAGAMAMLGFARRFRPIPRTTADWMDELRARERE